MANDNILYGKSLTQYIIEYKHDCIRIKYTNNMSHGKHTSYTQYIHYNILPSEGGSSTSPPPPPLPLSPDGVYSSGTGGIVVINAAWKLLRIFIPLYMSVYV